VLKDIPRFAAITVVAPTVRFNAFAIFFTPFLSRAIDFNNRRSSLVHARLTSFFFLAISIPFLSAAVYHTNSFGNSKTIRRRRISFGTIYNKIVLRIARVWIKIWIYKYSVIGWPDMLPFLWCLNTPRNRAMPIDRKFHSIAALCGDGLRPELQALFDRLAVKPSELFVREDGIVQSGPDPKSEAKQETDAQIEPLRKLKQATWD
jgi:hypothetical protein